MLEQTNTIAIDMLLLIGQTINGLTLKDLKKIFIGRDDIQSLLAYLEETSLVVMDADSYNYRL
jgi:hypothetical protein